MRLVHEYDYYEAFLTISVYTQRPDAAPSNVLYAATMHEEFASRVRAALREYKAPLNSFLEFYAVRKIQPSGSVRDVDRDYNQDILRLQFSLGFTLVDAAQIGEEAKVFAFERDIEQAVKDLLKSLDIPHLFIPDQEGICGESYIDIICTLGGATNIGEWSVNDNTGTGD